MAEPTPDTRKGQHAPFWKHHPKSTPPDWNKKRRGLIWTVALLLGIYALTELPWFKLEPARRMKQAWQSLRHDKSSASPTIRLDYSEFSADKALTEVRDFLAIGPRDAGTTGAKQAADYIAARLKLYGLKPTIDEFTATTPEGPTLFRNVVVQSPRADGKFVLCISHYDTKSGISDTFVGANDSGSSTGLLLEMARATKRFPGLSFAFVDGEECRRQYGSNDGLHGSRRLLEQLRAEKQLTNILAVIVLDMVGDRNLSVTLPPNSTPALASLVLNSAAEENARLKFSLGDGPGIDDHTPFFEAHLPVVDIIDFQYGSKPGENDYWHTAQDTIDKLSAESIGTVGRVALRTIAAVLSRDQPLPITGRP